MVENMKKSPVTQIPRVILQGSILVSTALVATPSQALRWQFDNGFLLNVDTTLGYSAQWRTENRDEDLEAVLNDNDGNNSFDDGSMTSSKANVLLEVAGEYNDFSFFVRGDALYDYVYADSSSNMSRDNYLSFNSSREVFDASGKPGTVDRGDFPDETVDEHGKRVRLLDAFATYNFNLGEMGGSLRAGRQVISWGEATFYPGVNAVQNPIDAATALAPGVEAKEVFLPTTAVDLKWDFTPNLSTELYYKLDWKRSTQPGVGSYLSTSDITGPGAERLLYSPGFAGGKVERRIEPDDDGQWGAAVRYLTDNGTNFDVYFTRSHSNIPGARVVIDLATTAGSVREVYSDDIDIWGASFSTNVSEAQVYADVAYSDNMPFVDLTPGFSDDFTRLIQSDVTRGEYYQVVAGFTDLYTAFRWLSEQITLLGEVIYQGNDLGDGKLSESDTGSRNGVLATEDAWGYQFRLSLKYFQVIRGMDVDVPITFKHDVDGYGNGIALNNGLKEDQKTASIGFTANYLTNWTFEGKYNWYFGNDKPEDKVLSDRDNISLTVKYRF
jgi:hypothetical protein